MAKSKAKAKGKASKGGINALLGAGSKKTASASKSTMPTIDAPEDLRPAIADWIEADRAEKTAQTNKEAAESKLIDDVTDLRVQKCRADGKIYPSIRLNGGNSGVIKAVQRNRYKKMTADKHQDALLSVFGDEDFDRYFNIRSSITLDADKLTDQMAEKIRSALGEKAGEIMTVEQRIEPNEEYQSASIFDEKVAEKAEQAQTDGLCVPVKMSFLN